MRYLAPADTTGITLSTGPLAVVDGYVETPDKMPRGDIAGLTANGFTPAPVDAPAEPTAPAEAAKVKEPASKTAADQKAADGDEPNKA